MRRSHCELANACASVLATTNSTPLRPALIMLLTALPPAPPTPNTVMRGLSSRISGIFRLMVMAASWLRGPYPCGSCRSATGRWVELREMRSSEALAKPSSDPGDVAACPCHLSPRLPRFELLEVRRLWVDQEAGGGRECGA